MEVRDFFLTGQLIGCGFYIGFSFYPEQPYWAVIAAICAIPLVLRLSLLRYLAYVTSTIAWTVWGFAVGGGFSELRTGCSILVALVVLWVVGSINANR